MKNSIGMNLTLAAIILTLIIGFLTPHCFCQEPDPFSYYFVESYPLVPSTQYQQKFEDFLRELIEDPNERFLLLNWIRGNTDEPTIAEIIRLGVGIFNGYFAFGKLGDPCTLDTGGKADTALQHQMDMESKILPIPKIHHNFQYYAERDFTDLLIMLQKLAIGNNRLVRKVCEFRTRMLACQQVGDNSSKLECACITDSTFDLVVDPEGICQIKIGADCNPKRQEALANSGRNLSRIPQCALTSHCSFETYKCTCVEDDEEMEPEVNHRCQKRKKPHGHDAAASHMICTCCFTFFFILCLQPSLYSTLYLYCKTIRVRFREWKLERENRPPPPPVVKKVMDPNKPRKIVKLHS